MSEVRIFRFIAGHPVGEPHPGRPIPAITVPAGMTDDEIERLGWIHALAALGEGMCPQCAHGLAAPPFASRNLHSAGKLGTPWLYCRNCPCYWQADHSEQRVTWEAWWAWEGLSHPSDVAQWVL